MMDTHRGEGRRVLALRRVRLEDVRAREGARLRRAPTRGEWAAAANYSSEAALRADRARMRACRDELIARNLRLVLSVAGRYKPQPGLEFDDLVAEGNFGLAKAAARFDRRGAIGGGDATAPSRSADTWRSSSRKQAFAKLQGWHPGGRCRHCWTACSRLLRT